MTKCLAITWNNTKNHITNNKIILPSSKCAKTRSITSSSEVKNKKNQHSTVDEDEIKKFSALKDWWNPNGSMKPLHSMNDIRVPFIRDGLVPCSQSSRSIKPLADKKILDVGCGGGILSEGLARIGANVTGIDATKEMIDIAIEHRDVDPKIADNKPEYLLTTIEEHSLNHKNYYDGLIASEVIEHVNNKEEFVKCCIEVTKPGGRLFFTTPNRTRISQFAAIFMAEYVLRMLPIGTHQYDKFITPTELTFLLEKNNCQVEAVYGTFYDFLSNKWQFVKPKNLMYALQAVKLN